MLSLSVHSACGTPVFFYSEGLPLFIIHRYTDMDSTLMMRKGVFCSFSELTGDAQNVKSTDLSPNKSLNFQRGRQLRCFSSIKVGMNEQGWKAQHQHNALVVNAGQCCNHSILYPLQVSCDRLYKPRVVKRMWMPLSSLCDKHATEPSSSLLICLLFVYLFV